MKWGRHIAVFAWALVSTLTGADDLSSSHTRPSNAPVRLQLVRYTPPNAPTNVDLAHNESRDVRFDIHESPRHIRIQAVSSRETFLGHVTASPGDLTDDGRPELIITASRHTESQGPRAGSVFLFTQSRDGWVKEPLWRYNFNRPNAQFGREMECAGDFNGDGIRDLAVSALRQHRISPDRGALRVFYGRKAGFDRTSNWSYIPEQRDGKFGASLAVVDVNADGFSDLIVGSPFVSHHESNEGAIFVFHGSKDGLASKPSVSIFGDSAGARFGDSLAIAGDVNGDGFQDILVGSSEYPHDGKPHGRVWLIAGGTNGLSRDPIWSQDGSTEGSQFGYSLCAAGDVNKDGCSDFYIGAPSRLTVRGAAGSVSLFLGGKSGPNPDPMWTVSDGQIGGAFGLTLANVGDVDGDGWEDVLIGAPYVLEAPSNRGPEGRAYLYRGSAQRPASAPSWILAGLPDYKLGLSLGALGDLNRDGFNDFAIGSPDRDRVDLFLGGRQGFRFGDTFPVTTSTLQDLDELRESAVEPSSTASPSNSRNALFIGLISTASLLTISLIVIHRRQKLAARKERARIARDLHDDLGARLTCLSVLMNTPNHSNLSAEDSERHRQLIGETAREILTSMDQVIWAETPESDTVEGLITFILQYSTTFFASTSIRCECNAPLNVAAHSIAPQFKKNVFLVVKECLNNIAKHSGASVARVDLSYDDRQLTIQITDNGRGLPLPRSGEEEDSPSIKRSTRAGNGLRNMESRIHELGGKIQWDTPPEGGTLVRISVIT